jgi:hypothetical protein
MYLLHYVFVVWMQYALTEVALVAVAKAAIVLAITLALSWALAAASGGLSFGAKLAAAKQ